MQRDNHDEREPLTALAEGIAEVVKEILSALAGEETMTLDGGGAAATSSGQNPRR